MKIINICLYFSVAVLSGCSLFEDEPDREPVVVGSLVVHSSAYKNIDEGRYQEAFDKLEAELTKNPIGPQTITHQYAAGLALMGLGRFDEAIERFQIVVTQTEKKDNQMFTEALYQKGKGYEAIGEDGKALAAFLDVLSRKRYLRQEVAEIEVPARIAGVYMRQRQPQQANAYYSRADKAFLRLKKAESSQSWMPKALFGMGKSSPREISFEDFDTGLVAFRRGQTYLVKCMEMNRAPWSERASGELKWMLESAWRTIESVKASDDIEDVVAAMKSQQDKRIEMGLVLDATLSAMKKEFIAGVSDKSPHIVSFQEYLNGFEKKLDALIMSRPVQEGLTPEALKREGITREGKVIDPEGRLEKNKRPTK